MSRIEVIGADKFREKLKVLSNPNRFRVVIRKNGALLTSVMKRKAIFTKGYSKGDTKKSIALDITDGGMTAEVAPTTEYAEYVELGTRYMQAQPFVRPALNVITPLFLKDMRDVLKGVK